MKRIGIVIAALLTSACASIPNAGPVVEGQAIDVRANNGFVRVIPRPPQTNITPDALVKGFLSACASLPDGDNTAFEYLTPSAAAEWDPDALAHVYNAAALKVETVRGANVSITAPLEAIIDKNHRFITAKAGSFTSEEFTIRKVAGQWRIASVPKALYLAAGDIERSFREYPIYFLDSTLEHVIPEYVMLPVGAIGLARLVLQELIAGPKASYRSALRTAIPARMRMNYDTVMVQGGTATVKLDERARQLGDAERRALAAQLTWTLTALQSVSIVRLTVDGESFIVPGVTGDNVLEDWTTFDPTHAAGAMPLAFVDRAGAHVIRDGVVTALAKGARINAVAVSRDVTMWVLIEQDHKLVSISSASGTQIIGRGTDLSAVALLPDDTVWFLDRAPSGGLRVWDSTGGVREVAVELPKTAHIVDFAISPDRVRIAVVVNDGTATSLHVGALTRTTSGVRIVGLERVEQRLTAVDLVAWRDLGEVVALGAIASGSVQPVLVDLARGTVSQLGGPPNIATLTASRNEGIVVGDQSGQLWSYIGGLWSASEPGSAPNYAL